MSATRLLVLGAVRIFQPVHGYLVRRELLSWKVEHWAHVNPGSIYSALRTLTAGGCLAESAAEATGTGPARTAYCLTRDGETEFFSLLRSALWHVDVTEPAKLEAALSFMTNLSRDEVATALAARASEAEAGISERRHQIAQLHQTRSAPAFVVEHVNHEIARLRAEIDFAGSLAGRLAQGHYRFAPEPGWDDHPGPEGWPGPLDEAP